jgi:hypothetical protein
MRAVFRVIGSVCSRYILYRAVAILHLYKVIKPIFVNIFHNHLNKHVVIIHKTNNFHPTDAVATMKLKWANVHESARVFIANNEHLQVLTIWTIPDHTSNNAEFIAHFFRGIVQNRGIGYQGNRPWYAGDFLKFHHFGIWAQMTLIKEFAHLLGSYCGNWGRLAGCRHSQAIDDQII